MKRRKAVGVNPLKEKIFPRGPPVVATSNIWHSLDLWCSDVVSSVLFRGICQLFGYAILGFALTEAIALFALMMAFLILFVFRVKFVWKPSRLFSAR